VHGEPLKRRKCSPKRQTIQRKQEALKGEPCEHELTALDDQEVATYPQRAMKYPVERRVFKAVKN
jgi:hypothetical protein